jgi:hypothetical protein
MRRLIALAALAFFAGASPSHAQVFIVASCGTVPASQATLTAGNSGMLFIDTTGKLCASVSVSASITGFTPATTGTPISVTTGGVTGSLPAGAVVAAFNTGATNTAYCKLGASATTSDIAIPPASWFAFTVGAATQLTCITSTSTTTVNMVGGSGLPTGAGGGGGGSGGAVTIASGADVAQGAIGDTAWVSGNGTTIGLLKAIVGAVNAAIPAGTARIGYVSDDPCTQLTKTNLAIATASGTTQIVAPSGSTQVYVCSISLISASTAVVNLVGGTGATCTTGTPVAALGSTTAASGMSLAANGGLTFGNGGATVVRTTTAGHGLCLIQSGTTALAGNITYIQQ